jgi:hypothetical protein
MKKYTLNYNISVYNIKIYRPIYFNKNIDNDLKLM